MLHLLLSITYLTWMVLSAPNGTLTLTMPLQLTQFSAVFCQLLSFVSPTYFWYLIGSSKFWATFQLACLKSCRAPAICRPHTFNIIVNTSFDNGIVNSIVNIMEWLPECRQYFCQYVNTWRAHVHNYCQSNEYWQFNWTRAACYVKDINSSSVV